MILRQVATPTFAPPSHHLLHPTNCLEIGVQNGPGVGEIDVEYGPIVANSATTSPEGAMVVCGGQDTYGERLRKDSWEDRDGMPICEIAREFHHSRRKIREILNSDGQPKAYSRQRQHYRKLGDYLATIEEILAADEHEPPKQRHTAMRIFERLKAQHYQGGYDAVRRYVGKRRKRKRETFIPLSHDPGQRIEADFGQIYVDFPDGRRAGSVLDLGLVVFKLSVRRGVAHAAYGSHSRRDGSRLQVLWPRSARGMVGQPQVAAGG